MHIAGPHRPAHQSGEQNAGNINDKLLPPPVPATCTIGLVPRMIAWITCFYMPRNCAAGLLIISRNCASTSTIRIRPNRRNRASSRTLSNPSTFRLPPTTSPSSAPKPRNRCHCRLTQRNLSRCAAVPNTPYCSSRTYNIPATCVLYPACKSHALPNVSSSSSSNASSSPVVSSAPNALFRYRFEIL